MDVPLFNDFIDLVRTSTKQRCHFFHIDKNLIRNAIQKIDSNHEYLRKFLSNYDSKFSTMTSDYRASVTLLLKFDYQKNAITEFVDSQIVHFIGKSNMDWNFLLSPIEVLCESVYDGNFLDSVIRNKKMFGTYKSKNSPTGGNQLAQVFGKKASSLDSIIIGIADSDFTVESYNNDPIFGQTFNELKNKYNEIKSAHKGISAIIHTPTRSIENLIPDELIQTSATRNSKNLAIYKILNNNDNKLLNYICFKRGVEADMSSNKLTRIWEDKLKELGIISDTDNIRSFIKKQRQDHSNYLDGILFGFCCSQFNLLKYSSEEIDRTFPSKLSYSDFAEKFIKTLYEYGMTFSEQHKKILFS